MTIPHQLRWRVGGDESQSHTWASVADTSFSRRSHRLDGRWKWPAVNSGGRIYRIARLNRSMVYEWLNRQRMAPARHFSARWDASPRAGAGPVHERAKSPVFLGLTSQRIEP